VLGVLLGGAAVVGSARLVQSLLFGVSAVSPAALAVAALMLTAAATLAMLPPSWESANRDPMTVLRLE
jgi:ABC-type antimicrobial peptide transport system permease subunit